MHLVWYTLGLSVDVVTHDVYFPSVFYAEVVASDQFNSTSVATEACETLLETVCPATLEQYNNFESQGMVYPR
jgi:hypothetical protein